MSVGILTAILFILLALLLLSGLPLAFGLGATAVVLALWQMGPDALFLLTTTAFSSWTSYTLVALPLFVLMANFLARSGIADDLYEMMYHWMGALRGGLAMGTVLICAVFAAMSGVSAAGTVTMGLVALPSMLKRNYHKDIALGCICAGGSLGILIPPSIIMIVFASLSGASVGKLFIAGVLPGLIICALFVVYIGIRSLIQPSLGPSIPEYEKISLGQKARMIKAVIFPMALVFLVLGSIYTGIATPTEASAIGSFGALICAAMKRRLSWAMFKDSTVEAFKLSVMVGWIVLGAKSFSHIYAAIGAGSYILELISSFEINSWLILLAMQLVLFLLGMFIDPIGIMMITLPVFLPLSQELGFDLIWFGILFTVNMELAFITPPFGMNLFYMKGVVPPGITMGDVYRSILPFIVLELIGLILLVLFPQLVLWLPNAMAY
ncbi:MAG: TRAP transporter large permease subunit [Acidobacteriota bacterium]|nr:TRAP transporter large permease subunit [Acidobacteriota bacterium]